MWDLDEVAQVALLVDVLILVCVEVSMWAGHLFEDYYDGVIKS